MIRAVVYTRVSTQGQADEGVSLDMQLELARKYCDEKGWALTEIYTDVMSGRSNKRPEFKRMEADAKARRFDVLIFYKLDRLARSAATFYRVAPVLMAYDVQLVSLTEDLDFLTASGKAMVGMQAVFAEFFSNQLSERVKGAMRSVAAKGRLAGGIVPLGYRRVDGQYELEPAEAEVVKEAFETFLRLKSGRATCEHLNGLGLKTKRGLAFHQQGLKVLLQNPVYCGMLAYGKNEVISGPNGKRKRRLERSEWVTVDGAHPAIITKEAWEEAQRILEENTGKHSRVKYGQNRYAWSGIIRCKACGELCIRFGSSKRFFGEGESRKGYVSPSYMCRTFNVRGKSACPDYAYVSDTYLNLHVVPAIAEAIDDALAGASSAKAPKKKAPGIDHRARRLAELEAKRDREKELFRAGYIDFEEMAANIKRLEAQIAGLAREHSEPERQVIALPGSLKALWPALVEAERGELLRTLIEYCEASKTDFTVHFKPYEGLPASLTVPRVNVRGPKSARQYPYR